MRFEELFPSKYLKADDLAGSEFVLTINSVDKREFEDQKKAVVCFEETEKELILNRTNFRTIAQIHGNNTHEWASKKVQLFATQVDFKGQPTQALRIRPEDPDKPVSVSDEIPF